MRNYDRVIGGGFTYLSPEYCEKNVGEGTILDVNSLYPSVMYTEKLPFGDPIRFEGKYVEDKVYDLYIQKITCRFRIKKNKIPTIQIKNNMSFMPNEYLEYSGLEPVSLMLTSIDLKLFLEQYDILGEENIDDIYEGGWKFKSIKGMFTEYIDKWIDRKIKATKEKNAGQRQLSKIILNSLYGKFATQKEVKEKYCYLDENGIVKYYDSEKIEKEGIYLPVACFITAYARNKTIRTAQSIKDYSIKKYGKNLFAYTDTDSLHCLLSIEELKQFCDIDDVRLRSLGV